MSSTTLPTTSWVRKGFLYGLAGTLAMSIIMVIGLTTGVSPIPEPIPIAIAKLLLGSVPMPLLMITGIILHFGYGATAGAMLYAMAKQKGTIWYGLGWGGMLWLIMELIVLPILGWGAFGTAITPAIAVATMVLHLIYGGTLGWGFRR